MALFSVAQSMRSAVRLGRRSGGLEQLRHVLPSLRTTDPSVSIEFASGTIGLPTGLLSFGRRDLFDAALDEPAKARDLFSFSWLAHLDAARTELSERQVRDVLTTWSRHHARRSDIAAEPAVMARRAMSLLAHADAGLPGATHREFDIIMALVAEDFAVLGREVKRMPVTAARLTAQIALVAFALAAEQSEGRILDAERRLISELNRQIHPDGGHISRNPAALLEAALDLVPLRRLYAVCQRPVPETIPATIARIGAMLRRLQMPDLSLGRFNGMGATPIGELLTVLRQIAIEAPQEPNGVATDSGYIRVTAGKSVILFDAGPGVESLPGEAPFAGALSFEFGTGNVALVVNSGAGRETPAKSHMRATTSHSALVYGGASSAPLIGGRAGYVHAAIDSAAPGANTSDAVKIVAANDGYKARHGVVHHRTLTLSRDGTRLVGVDRLEAAKSQTPGPYEIHFHLHPSVHVEPAPDRRSVKLTAGDGSLWLFMSDEAVPAIEASIYYAGASGPKPTVQLVLRGTFPDLQQVGWRLEQV